MSLWEAGSRGSMDTVRFSSSWILSPPILFSLRLLFTLYIFTTIFTVLGLTPYAAGRDFSFFTALTFWGLGFYFAFATLHTGTYWLRGQPLLRQWPRALQIMHSMLYTTITTFPFVVTTIFWALIFKTFSDDETFEIWSNISRHALNLAFSLFEIIVPRTNPTPWIHTAVLVVILLGYLGVAYITYGVQHFYVYSFLDVSKHSRGAIAGYILGILVLTLIVFLVVHFAILGRVILTEKKLEMMGKLSANDKQVSRSADVELGETRYAKMAGSERPSINTDGGV